MIVSAGTGSLVLSGGSSFAASPPADAVTCPTANVCSQIATDLGPVQGLALDGQGNIYVTTDESGGEPPRVPAAGGTATLIASDLGGRQPLRPPVLVPPAGWFLTDTVTHT